MIFKSTRALILALSLTLQGAVVWAQSWPVHAVKLVVPFPAGTAADVTARLLGEVMANQLGQAVVVENIPGAGGNVGAQRVAKATADGYTVLFSSSSMANNMRLFKTPGFDTMNDFIHVGGIGMSDSAVVVHADSGVKTLKDLVERAKAQGGKISYGSGGVGSGSHLSAAWLLHRAGAQGLHVPFKGGIEAVTALMGQQLDFVIPVTSVAVAQAKGNKLRMLAVTGPKRNAAAPEVPTLEESGYPDLVVISFSGLSVPKATPPAVVASLSGALAQALQTPALRTKLTDLGYTVTPTTSVDYTKLMAKTIADTEGMMKAADISPN